MASLTFIGRMVDHSTLVLVLYIPAHLNMQVIFRFQILFKGIHLRATVMPNLFFLHLCLLLR